MGALCACSEGADPVRTVPPTVRVGDIELTSPLGGLLDVGASTQLSVTVRDTQGGVMTGVVLTWTSSDAGVVSVSGDGVITAVSDGSATIRGAADGVTGTLSLTVVDADLEAIGALALDAFASALAAAASAERRARVQAALATCAAAAGQGRLEDVEACVAAVRAEASAATDASDRTLLAVLVLFIDEIERRLTI